MENMEQGKIKISEGVIEIIAGIAATDVEGVTRLKGNMTDGINQIIGKKSLTKGVTSKIEEEVIIGLEVIVKYGVKIREVAEEVQKRVKEEIEMMTGLTVAEVNVNVQGVEFEEEKEQNEEVEVKRELK